MFQYSSQVSNGQMTIDQAIVECNEDIKNSFFIESFVDFWPVINNVYTELGFTDQIPDDKRIQEYKYIYEQYLKYIFTRQDKIWNDDKNYEKMYNAVIEFREKTDTAATTRKGLAYEKLRNYWLDNLIDRLSDIRQLITQFKEEGNE